MASRTSVDFLRAQRQWSQYYAVTLGSAALEGVRSRSRPAQSAFSAPYPGFGRIDCRALWAEAPQCARIGPGRARRASERPAVSSARQPCNVLDYAPVCGAAGRFCGASMLSILPDAESRRFACVFARCEEPQHVLIDGLRRSAVVSHRLPHHFAGARPHSSVQCQAHADLARGQPSRR